MADPGEAVVNRLLNRINELADAISPQVEAETRCIFRNENVRHTSSSIASNTSSTPETTQQAVLEPQPPSVVTTTSTTPQSLAIPTQSHIPDSRTTFIARRQFGGQRSSFTQRQRRILCRPKPKVADTRPFMRDLVLLSGPHDNVVPRQGSRLTLMEKGHVILGCRFNKAMNAAQVQLAIIEAFDGKIPDDVDIELLVSMHTSLVVPSLARGQQGIDGAMVQRLYQNKPVYIRPNRQLIRQTNEASQQASRMKCDNIPYSKNLQAPTIFCLNTFYSNYLHIIVQHNDINITIFNIIAT